MFFSNLFLDGFWDIWYYLELDRNYTKKASKRSAFTWSTTCNGQTGNVKSDHMKFLKFPVRSTIPAPIEHYWIAATCIFSRSLYLSFRPRIHYRFEADMQTWRSTNQAYSQVFFRDFNRKIIVWCIVELSKVGSLRDQSGLKSEGWSGFRPSFIRTELKQNSWSYIDSGLINQAYCHQLISNLSVIHFESSSLHIMQDDLRFILRGL